MAMMSKLLIFLCVLAAGGCATSGQERIEIGGWLGPDQEFKTWQEEINVNSEPPSAKVYVNDVFQGTTPTNVRLTIRGVAVWARVRLYRVEGNSREFLREERINPEWIRTVTPAGQIAVYQEGYTRKDPELRTLTPAYRIVVYKEGYKRQEKVVSIGGEKIRAIWQYPEGHVLTDSWTAFLQKDERPLPMPPALPQQQQQQQQQIIIETPKAVSYLSVSSEPSSAEVYVDGKLVGTTPINSIKLRPGNYRLRIVKENREWERDILLPEDGSLQISAELK